MAQGQRQTWSLSQEANKSSGVCSHCHATRQLHLKDGTVHRHGPRHSPCPGSDRPPLATQSASSAAFQLVASTSPALAIPSSSSAAAPPLLVISSSSTVIASALSSKVAAVPISDFSHPQDVGGLIKHIPKS